MNIFEFTSLVNFNTVTVTIVVVLLILLVSRSLQWPANIPPGPTGYPIIGCITLLRNRNILEVFRELRGQYGDVFSLKIGPNLNVIINGREALREAFIKQGDEFADRPGGFLEEKMFQEKGIVFSSGNYVKQIRTFTSATFRNLGFEKRSLELRIQEEVTAYLEIIEKQNGEPYDMKGVAVLAVSNVICSMTFGNRFDYNDTKFKRLTTLISETLRLLVVGGVINTFPWLRFLPGDRFSIKKIVDNIKEIKDFIGEQIQEHRHKMDRDNPRDFIEAFLIQQQKKNSSDEDLKFDDMDLMISVMNLFFAGTDTTATIIHWAMLFLIHNKPIQDKLRQEIMTVVGSSRLPSLADKTDMPYYEAFMTEVFRKGNIVPLSLPHGAKKDISFRGMVIPKGSTIMPNFDSVMSNPDLFEDPDEFRPERFLGQDGKMNGKERDVMAFSLGRRVCLGESLARMELFLFMTSLLQRFEFLPESPDKLPTFDATLGITRAAKDYSCRAIKIQ
ncbi:cytochrome P450 2B19-like [Argopecten irradians]|uniref:cytochrome P450 2B19-like n=1 Tax=Argopecten irradians TaxID=31199 RepID=UPI003710479A